MRVLIVGGTSALGTALKQSISTIGEVITAGRTNCDIHLDLNDSPEKINLPENIDSIIHLAAKMGGSTDDEIIETINVNVLGTLKICQAAAKANVKHIVLISSIFVSLKEDSPYYGIYPISKKQSEEIAKFYCSLHNIRLTILRPSQIYGNEISFSRHQPFFYKMIELAENGEDILLYGKKDPMRNYLHIEDLKIIISRVIEMGIEGTYSCAFPFDNSYSHIGNAAIAAFGSKGKLLFLQDKPDIPDNVFAKETYLYEKIGFYPQISIEEGMQIIANFRRNNK